MKKFTDIANSISINDNILNKIPLDFNNLILYGPHRAKKYIYALKLIQKFSLSSLQYEKKLCVGFNGDEYYYKISDIHIEINFEFLGCSSKNLWDNIYKNICQINRNNDFIVLCKNFSEINNELLETFYIYMNNKIDNLRFIFLTDHISFLPNNIINSSIIFSIKSLTTTKLKEEKIEHNFIQKLIDIIESKTLFSIKALRTLLYDILIYQLDTYEFFYDFLKTIINKKNPSDEKINKLLNKINITLKKYNNNYRSIYHLENLVISIIDILYYTT